VTFIDYVLIAILLVSTVVSLFRGFLTEAISLAAWVVAIWAAWKFGPAVAGALEGSIDSLTARLWGARSLLLVGVLLAGGLLNWMVNGLLQKSGLSGVDRAIGTLFGFARGVVLASLLVVVLDLVDFSVTAWWQDSKLIPYAAPVAGVLKEAAEEGMEILDRE
jgi:membrane protein required for colicin V production